MSAQVGVMSRLYQSTVGRKLVMAVTGIALVGFVIVHLAGNLLAWVGPDAMNNYAVGLQKLGPLLWIARIALLVFVVNHIALGIKVTMRNKGARTKGYAERQWLATTVQSRLMAAGGVVLLVFILFHLAHYTFGWVQSETFAGSHVDASNRPDVYSMMLAGFRNVGYSAAYIVAMAALGMHLAHGASSMFQTLGLNHPKYNGLLRKIGPILGVLLAVGFASIPLGVLLGFIK